MAAVDPEELASPFSIRLFGPFEAYLNGSPLPRLRFRKSPWLLALLALRHGAAVERDWLIGLLWPESPGSQALRNGLTDLRRGLGDQASRLHSPTPYTLSLDLAGAAVDAVAFDAAIARGDPGSLEEAVALYRGPLLEGCSEEWAFQERQAREQAYLAARERLAARAVEQGAASEAEQHLRRAVAVDPLRESAQRTLMQVLAGGGNYAAALHSYRELRHHLHRELNAAPDSETQTLFQQLRSEGRRRAAKGSGMRDEGYAHSAGTRMRGEKDPPSSALTPRSSFLVPEAPLTLTPRSAPELPAAVLREALTRAPLVGREAELAALERRLAAGFRGEGGVVLLAGEPGIGKTRLATAACALARQRGVRVLIGHCEEQGVVPYQPAAEALRGYLGSLTAEQAEALLPPAVAGELVRLVPRLAETVKEVPPASAASGAAARQALVDAMGEFFGLLTRQQGPALLFLEDLHWADEGSLAMLHSLARRAAGLPLLIVGTYRDLPPDFQHPLAQTLAALHRERLSERLPLRRLPEAGVVEMVAALLDGGAGVRRIPYCVSESDQGASAPGPAGYEIRTTQYVPPSPFLVHLYQQTEGNPFFVEEVLQHLVEEGALSRRAGRWQIEAPAQFQAPASVQAAIGRRLEHLAAESREALTLAAVIGPQFDFEVLLAASGVEEERLLGWVEEWLGARLVIEEPDRAATVRERYRFHHALIREVVYGGVSRRRQGQLHERVGWALETVCGHDPEEPLEELARHFARAHSQVAREKGVEYCLRAGGKAQGLSAGAEAIEQFRGALRLLEGLPEDEAHWRLRYEAAVRLGSTHRGRLEWELVRQVWEEYRARAERAGRPWDIASAHMEWTWLVGWEIRLRGSGDIALGRRHGETSLALCEREGLADLLPRVRSVLASLLMREPGSDLPRAAALLRQVLDSDDQRSNQWQYRLLAGIYARLGKWGETMAVVRESLAAKDGVAGGNLGLALLEEGLDAQGRQAEFIAFCDDARRRLAQAGVADPPLAQWYLVPAEPCARFIQVAFQDDFEGPALREKWQWCDPLRVNAYRLGGRAGCLTLRAAEGTDLGGLFLGFNAPRLLLEVQGDFALEARMEGDWDQRDTGGSSGLLVWKDMRNFLLLEKYCMGYYGSVTLSTIIPGGFRVGRGLLRGSAFHLRLEREGERFTGLCSTDGVHWLTCGQVEFPARDPLLVGIASLQGMVAHFDWVRVLTKP